MCRIWVPYETVATVRDPDWELLADAIPHIVWMFSPQGYAEYFNHHGTRYTGLRAGTRFDAAAWASIVHPEDMAGARREWITAMSKRVPFESEYRLLRIDGAYRRHAFRSVPMFDESGEITRWIGTATDIHEQYEVTRRLEEASLLLAALQSAAPVGLGLVDKERNLVQVNDEMASVRGRAASVQRGAPAAEALPELWDQIEPAFHSVLASGETVRNVQVVGMTAADPGQFHEWLASCYAVEIDDALIGVGVVTVDVTARSQANEFRNAVMSQVSDGVYTQDAEGRLVYMNRAASRMLGWTEEELCGKKLHDVIHFQRPDGTPVDSAQCALQVEGMTGRLTRSVGEAFTRKDGSIFPVAYSSVPLYIGHEVEGVAVVFRDISDPGAARNRIRLQVVDSHLMVTDAFELLLRTEEGIEVVASSATSADAIVDAERVRPHVILIDFALPDVDGIATARVLKLAVPEASLILMHETHDEAVVQAAIEAGCAGILDKARAWVELVGAVRAAYHGHTVIPHEVLQRVVPQSPEGQRRHMLSFLTDREREVLTCISDGLTNQAVAQRLGVTANTVRNHVQRILWKLGVHSKLEAVVLAGLTRDAD